MFEADVRDQGSGFRRRAMQDVRNSGFDWKVSDFGSGVKVKGSQRLRNSSLFFATVRTVDQL